MRKLLDVIDVTVRHPLRVIGIAITKSTHRAKVYFLGALETYEFFLGGGGLASTC